MKNHKIPEQLKEAKEAFKAEIKEIHSAKHHITDFDEFAKAARLELQTACGRLARKNPHFIFKLGEVKVATDPDNGKKFLLGNAYVGPKKKEESTLFVSLTFTLANEPVG